MAASHRGTKAEQPPAVHPGVFAQPEVVQAHAAQIEESHQRCMALGLSRIERPDHQPLMRSDLVVARERNLRLSNHAAPVMEMLFEQIVDSHSMIILTDAQGTILHSVGDTDFLERAGRVALSPGVNWAEYSKGTNAIGTALFAEAPTVVHAGEHFMHANNFLTCSATPIFDPRGNMLGVLDVSGDHRTYHRHTMGLVRMSARMIENQWLSDDYSNRLRLHFHRRVGFLGTLVEGVVVVGADGKILGANRSALEMLSVSGASLRTHSLTSLFGTTTSAVFDHFRAPLAAPMQLHAPCGTVFFAAARFVWPPRAAVSGIPWLDAGDLETTVDVLQSGPADRFGSPLRQACAAGLVHLETGDSQVAATVDKVRRTLDRDIPLLILGPTGSGKEVLARAAHQDSKRAGMPFIAVSCASIPESLIEVELFGHEEGAFTGARQMGSTGLIMQANGGTLFLDEIGDMPMALQVRLLRVLQERCVTPLGSQKSISVDIAVISATHRDLRTMIDTHQFREDLYYRLNGLVVRLPALAERTDLQTLVRRILVAQAPERTLRVSEGVMDLLGRCAWPGNVRQLVNVLRAAAAMASGEDVITDAHLPDDFVEDARRAVPAIAKDGVAASAGEPARVVARVAAPASSVCATPASALGVEERADAEVSTVDPQPTTGSHRSAPDTQRTLQEGEIEMIRAALDDANGNISAAARRLGVSRNTIYRKMRWNRS